MPPKGPKRGAQAAASTPTPQQRKRQKTGQKPDTIMAGVVDALGKAEGLPADCRAMLEACIPSSLGTPASERQEPQAAVVSWIGEIVQSVQAKLQEALDSAAAKVAEAESSKNELEGKLVESQAALAKEGETVAALKVACATKDLALQAANRCLLEADEAQKKGGALLAEAVTSKQEIEAALTTFVGYFKTEEGFDSGKAKEYVAKVMPMAEKLGLDDSLKTALPSACAMEPGKRGGFDKMVLTELEATFSQHVTDLASMLASGAEAEASRAAAVKSAQQAVTAAQEALALAVAEVKSAEAKEAEAAAAARAAEAVVAAAAKEVGVASASQEERQAEFAAFKDYNVLCFTMLRDKAAASAEAASPAVGA